MIRSTSIEHGDKHTRMSPRSLISAWDLLGSSAPQFRLEILDRMLHSVHVLQAVGI